MTQAVTIRRDGDIFQARMFWLRAARLLLPDTDIQRVGFEIGPKSFDDIWVDFQPGRARRDQYGAPLLREHAQCKWHSTPGTFGYADLIDPEFINANAKSLLQRAHDAHGLLPTGAAGVRFKLVTNWQIGRDDPLRLMVGTRSSALRVDRLFATKTDNSAAGAVRKLWREHLGIDEDALEAFAPALAFGGTWHSLEELRDHLDLLFLSSGLRRVSSYESAFFYDDLIFQWMGQGRLEFDAGTFRQACASEGLLATHAERTFSIGVKSFEHPFDPLEDRCTEVLDLTSEFDDRFIRDEHDWSIKLYPLLKSFLTTAATSAPRLQIVFDTHTSLAFAAGSVLNLKSGRAIDIEQRTVGQAIWSADDRPPEASWPTLDVETIDLANGKPDIAVAIGLTHDIAVDVCAYIAKSLPEVGQILVCRPTGGSGAQSIVCGRHAFDLAAYVTTKIRAAKADPALSNAHLFIAAPNAFSFFFGQRQALIGRSTLYEFDFQTERSGSYTPSITMPFASAMLPGV
ncbi:MAG: SAVED domain-containing protein [Sphingomonas sp.]|uniref:SAVED domain-containing protein n=1 Tax=Sphingomonas sp. TaxID=28214 RepID=UPI0035A845A1|nr:SAVED domain-containing protein [Sphingomonas sp.]